MHGHTPIYPHAHTHAKRRREGEVKRGKLDLTRAVCGVCADTHWWSRCICDVGHIWAIWSILPSGTLPPHAVLCSSFLVLLAQGLSAGVPLSFMGPFWARGNTLPAVSCSQQGFSPSLATGWPRGSTYSCLNLLMCPLRLLGLRQSSLCKLDLPTFSVNPGEAQSSDVSLARAFPSADLRDSLALPFIA